MGELLKQTLEVYTESWKEEHDKVMDNYGAADRLGDAVSIGIVLFERLFKKLSRDGAAHVKDVDCTLKSFDSWYNTASAVLVEVENLESEEFEVQGTKRLKECYAQATGVIEDLLDAKRAIAAVESTKAVSLESYLNELRNPVHR
ncbi:MAG: hypothetical protein L0228_21045 [Planctomycetes bacterium]|nr:hypothetical protein [Planctomycetota bacterium]